VQPTPPPPKHEGFPVVPPCMCPIPFPGMQHRRRQGHGAPAPAPAVARGPAPAAAASGEIEVLTVDVKLANKVRCDNASLAKDVAKLLHIPVQRVTVAPWSWTTDVAQDNYLAFVQENHERCDCTFEGGELMRGKGFRKVNAETDGAAVESDSHTSVMTVAEYRAMMAAAQHSGQGTPVPAAAAPAAPAGPPPARVQMLTRDPCLVHLLRTKTKYFRKRLAFLLGVPEDKLIVDPPAVKGTVGLLQLSTRLNSESATHEKPFLAVHHCPAAEAAELEDRLHSSLLSYDNAPVVSRISVVPGGAWPLERALTTATAKIPSPVVAPNAPILHDVSAPAPAPAPRQSYAIASPRIATNETQRVSLAMRMTNINYDIVAANWTLVSILTSMAQSAIGMSGHIPANAVKVSLFPGSLVIEATITPPSGTAPEAIVAFLEGADVCNQTALQFNALAGLRHAAAGEIGCDVVSLALEDPPFLPEEENRAWIAFWSVVILPPFDEEGAWRLLNLANSDSSPISKLLPMTLARVPGLQYRSLKEPNAANETRLPPPLDKAVGFRLPDPDDPVDEQQALRSEKDRMKRERAEHAAAVLRLERKSAMKLQKARQALGTSHLLTQTLRQADTTFTDAARAHAQAITGSNAAEVITPLDIVPPDVLADRDDNGESPYFWPQPPDANDSEDAPEALGLVQGPSARQSLRGKA